MPRRPRQRNASPIRHAARPLEQLHVHAAALGDGRATRAWSFSYTRGTPVITVGRTRLRSRATVSSDSAKIIDTPFDEIDVGDHALEAVTQRQERQRDVVLAQVEDGAEITQVGDEIPVREHHALGLTRRARRVDDGGEVVGTNAFGAILKLAPNAPALTDRLVPALGHLRKRHERDVRRGGSRRRTIIRRNVHHHDGAQVGERRPLAQQLGELHLRGHDRDAGATVAKDEADLLGRERRIDGTVTAPPVRIAKSASSQSGRLSASSTTRSPGAMPSDCRPRPISRTRSRNSRPLV